MVKSLLFIFKISGLLYPATTCLVVLQFVIAQLKGVSQLVKRKSAEQRQEDRRQQKKELKQSKEKKPKNPGRKTKQIFAPVSN